MSKEVSFEDDIASAKKILEQLKDPNITLKDSMKLYKDGKKKLLNATKILEEAKLEFEELNKDLS